MGRYNFQSAGGNVTDALLDLMVRQQAEKRQSMLDSLNTRNVESQMADREMGRKIQGENIEISRAAREQAANAAKVSAGIRVAETTPMGTELNADAEQALGDAHLSHLVKPGDPTYGVMDPSQGEGPTMDKHNTFAGTSKQEHDAEALAQKQQIAEMQADLKREHEASVQLMSEGRIKEAQQRMEMAQQKLEGMMKLQDLNAQLTQTKIDAAGDKKAAGEKAAKAGQDQRTEVRRLAKEIYGDKNLPSVLGSVAGAMPSMAPGSIALDAKIKRLNSMLSLEGRSALKGSGAISDFEASMLANSASTLGNQRVGYDPYRAELERIMSMSDAPDAAAPAHDNGPVVWGRGPDGRPRKQ